ncbi:MAG: hypothetical protein HQL46_11580 [Gammaproteobacteria bacterium]|nr:hypothetical protein [Gammaproteobacteria bacterium]
MLNKNIPNKQYYTKFFCEENIWHLCNDILKQKLFKQVEVVFLSNVNQQIAVFHQKSAPENQAIVWDYHVILKTHYQSKSLIFDFDSRLPFPCLSDDYIIYSLPKHIPAAYQAQFRLIAADIFLKEFYSDRSHMAGIIDHDKFPSYPAILSNKENKLRLKELIDFSLDLRGTVIKKTIE